MINDCLTCDKELVFIKEFDYLSSSCCNVFYIKHFNKKQNVHIQFDIDMHYDIITYPSKNDTIKIAIFEDDNNTIQTTINVLNIKQLSPRNIKSYIENYKTFQ